MAGHRVGTVLGLCTVFAPWWHIEQCHPETDCGSWATAGQTERQSHPVNPTQVRPSPGPVSSLSPWRRKEMLSRKGHSHINPPPKGWGVGWGFPALPWQSGRMASLPVSWTRLGTWEPSCKREKNAMNQWIHDLTVRGPGNLGCGSPKASRLPLPQHPAHHHPRTHSHTWDFEFSLRITIGPCTAHQWALLSDCCNETTESCDGDGHSHFTKEESTAQRGPGALPGSHGWMLAKVIFLERLVVRFERRFLTLMIFPDPVS